MKKIEDYLPYYLGAEVICTDKTASGDYEYYGKKGKVSGALLDKYSTGKWSLLLRPLSNMTEEEKTELFALRENEAQLFPAIITGLSECFKWLLSKHFDIFDLIPAGLALDATNI